MDSQHWVAAMSSPFKVRLVARNEGIEYVDEQDIYRFDVSQVDGLWRLRLPGSKGKSFDTHELTADEERVVLARVTSYLRARKYFGIIGSTHPVIVERIGCG